RRPRPPRAAPRSHARGTRPPRRSGSARCSGVRPRGGSTDRACLGGPFRDEQKKLTRLVKFRHHPSRQQVDRPSQLIAASIRCAASRRKDSLVIIVTGATGELNGSTVEHLLDRVPPSAIGVSVRDPRRAQHLADQRIRVRQGSYDDPDGLRDSSGGAEQVLLVSSSDVGADVVAQHRAAIDAAVEAGARRILYTSTHGAGFDTPYPPLAVHAATEEHLAASGVAWTALRNGFYGDLGQLL